MRGDLIHWYCAEPAHATAAGPDHLSIHEYSWAYCPGGVIGSDHRWEPTEGIALHDLGSYARERGLPSAAPPPANGSAAERRTRPAGV